MTTVIINAEHVRSRQGIIDLCPHMACGFKCCNFQQSNYIVLHPEELEEAVSNEVSIEHLRLLENYHGGFKAICTAKDTSTCDNGFKPLDCRSYPYFPTVINGELAVNLKGKKCPLPTAKTIEHARYVREEWTKVVFQKPAVLKWISKVELVGYEKVDISSDK